MITQKATPFSGSYRHDDVQFLLEQVVIEPTDIRTKETLIQSGRHYSEMLSPEHPPSDAYLEIFHEATQHNGKRLAQDLLYLAHWISQNTKEVVLVSLARGGTPIGIWLKRILENRGIDVWHYSISILRDRGLDTAALRHIADRHKLDTLYFVDGWSAKGTIARELSASIDRFNANFKTDVPNRLCVVSDLCGQATFSATHDDYLIPSSLLGATVSGLISRSLWNGGDPNHFHGCMYLDHLAPFDLSQAHIETIWQHIQSAPRLPRSPTPSGWIERARNHMDHLQQVSGCSAGHLKPGLGESTRALLRRVPDKLLLQDPDHPAVRHLLYLAEQKAVKIEVDSSMPFLSCALIANRSNVGDV
ncbi:MAG: tellurite-like stress resistance cysteine protease StiP [Deinococcaceae bacterium]